MSGTRTVDIFKEHPTAQVSIKVFYPDNTVAIFNDPDHFNESDGNIWIQTDQGALWVRNLPYHIVDKRPPKAR